MRSYPCHVVGINHEGRLDYIQANVRRGTALELMPEPDNPHDDKAVAVFHGDKKIGYIPQTKRWVGESIDEGDTHRVTAGALRLDGGGLPVALAINIDILADGDVPDSADDDEIEDEEDDLDPMIFAPLSLRILAA